jgi:hypothetical protein
LGVHFPARLTGRDGLKVGTPVYISGFMDSVGDLEHGLLLWSVLRRLHCVGEAGI